MADDTKKNNQLELHPFATIAESEPNEPQPAIKPESKPDPKPEPKSESRIQPQLPFVLKTVEDYHKREPEVYAEGRVCAGTITKGWKQLLPHLKPYHDYLSERGVNHIRGTTNCLPTWENWLAKFLRETGIHLNQQYVSSQVVAYEPGLPEWQPGEGVPTETRRPHRAESDHRQSRKNNSNATRREVVEEDKPLQSVSSPALGAQLAEHGGLGDPERLRQLSPGEVSGSLHDAFDEFAKWVRPDLKITVIVFAELHDDEEPEPNV